MGVLRFVFLATLVLSLFVPGAQAAPRDVTVNMIVLQDDAGRGNAHWAHDDRYTNAVFRLVNDIYSSVHVRFRVSKTVKRSSRDYYDKQGDLLNRYDEHPLRKKGQVLVIVSGEPYDGTSSGKAFYGPSTRPMMVVRSRFNDHLPTDQAYAYSDSGIRNSAFLFTHELGHMMGLKHGDLLKIKKGEFVHTENYVYPHHSGADGRRFYENFFKKCLVDQRNCNMASIKKLSSAPLPAPVNLPIYLENVSAPYPVDPVLPPTPTGKGMCKARGLFSGVKCLFR